MVERVCPECAYEVASQTAVDGTAARSFPSDCPQCGAGLVRPVTDGGQSVDGTEYVVNCRECDFWSIQPDMQNADRVRDGHEKEMFNWHPDEESCGPCAVAAIRTVDTGTDHGGGGD